jgi:hypothetical protein
MKNAKCPACIKVIQFDEKINLHDLIDCPYCGSLLEFILEFPPTLDWAEDPMVFSARRLLNNIY